jgi:hypothetical protein
MGVLSQRAALDIESRTDLFAHFRDHDRDRDPERPTGFRSKSKSTIKIMKGSTFPIEYPIRLAGTASPPSFGIDKGRN